MGMDLRRPIGILFLAYGVILFVYGLVSPHPVLDLNVNAIWGVVLALFGAVMLTLAWRARAPRRTQSTTPTGN
jgi:protein-S-isoprenylcysteine O-methyltransferase Ste14